MKVSSKEPAIWNPDVKGGHASLLNAPGSMLKAYFFFDQLISL